MGKNTAKSSIFKRKVRIFSMKQVNETRSDFGNRVKIAIFFHKKINETRGDSMKQAKKTRFFNETRSDFNETEKNY